MNRRDFVKGLGATAALTGLGIAGVKGAQVAGEVINGPKPESIMPEEFVKEVAILSKLKKIYDETKGQDKIRERFERLTELMFNLSETERKYVFNMSLDLRIEISNLTKDIPTAKIEFTAEVGYDYNSPRTLEKESLVEHPYLKLEDYSAVNIGNNTVESLKPFLKGTDQTTSNVTQQLIVQELMEVMNNFTNAEITSPWINFVPVPYIIPQQGVLNSFLTEIYEYNKWNLPDLTGMTCEVSIFWDENEPLFWFQLYDNKQKRFLSFVIKSDGRLSFEQTLAGPDDDVVASYSNGYQDAPIWQKWENSGRLMASEILGQVLPQIKNISTTP